MTYVVVKRGIYIRGVFGPYSEKSEAFAACEALALADVDLHHDWCVEELTPDGLGPTVRTLSGDFGGGTPWRPRDRAWSPRDYRRSRHFPEEG